MKKLLIISSIVAGSLALGGFVIYPMVKRSLIRKRLQEAFANPFSTEAIGGLDKLLVTGIFNRSSFNPAANQSTLSNVQARQRAQMIWENYSWWFSSDQAAILQAFSGLRHVDDVTKIAVEFFRLYKEELLTVLKVALKDSSYYSLLIGLIDNLPKNSHS